MEGESSAKLKGSRHLAGSLASSARPAPKSGSGKSQGKPRDSQTAAPRTELIRALRHHGVDVHAGTLQVDSMGAARRPDPDRSSDEAEEAKLETLARWRGVARVR